MTQPARSPNRSALVIVVTITALIGFCLCIGLLLSGVLINKLVNRGTDNSNVPTTLGSPVWQYQGQAVMTIRGSDNRVYVLDGSSVVALDMVTGAPLWRYENVGVIEKIPGGLRPALAGSMCWPRSNRMRLPTISGD